MVRNIGMELNLAVGRINRVPPNLVSPTFNIGIRRLYSLKYTFEYRIAGKFGGEKVWWGESLAK